MKTVRLIRHGESAVNAGEPTRDHVNIHLTAKGLGQAHMVAKSIRRPHSGLTVPSSKPYIPHLSSKRVECEPQEIDGQVMRGWREPKWPSDPESLVS